MSTAVDSLQRAVRWVTAALLLVALAVAVFVAAVTHDVASWSVSGVAVRIR